MAGLTPSPAIATSTAKDPRNIECPPAPGGWKPAAAEPKTVWDAKTSARFAGLQQVAVNCNYDTTTGKHIEVTVTYALPTDLNPNADFYFGCGNGNTAWTSTQRKFYVASGGQWAFATFGDPLRQIDDSEARRFEGVTRELLRNTEGYGHPCVLKVTPTALTSEFTFSFATGGTKGHGTFSTRGSLTRNGSDPIVVAHVPDISVAANGSTHAIKVRIQHGIDYHVPQPTPANGKIRLAVKVIASKIASCRKGDQGTLTITDAPSVTLTVCGQTLLAGKASVHILETA